MTKTVKAVTSPSRPSAADPESLDQLRGDCARMAPHWKAVHRTPPAAGRASDLRGIEVSAASAALVDGMSEYGD
ncbi:hypothetical protein [Streptomyces pinistramenti]|uniref:hypothetical protein n=1 Tax=Streptomyces pinistramenti TaxID=2884812 RepID=UPI001D09112E|nr:hypothetical protein [Streptomyces pinistramenti]MCB5909616.1 hypothetical protein [Streptomyces pinistramenti]